MLLWNIRENDTEFRQFTFKWNQGMTHGNTVISHFSEVDRRCAFCREKRIEERRRELGRVLTQNEIDTLQVEDENRSHIMWRCPVVNECVQEVYNKVWDTNRGIDKNSFLMGRDMGCLEATLLYMLCNMFIKYRIWKYKLAGVLPKPNSIANYVKNWIQEITWYHKWRIMLPLVRQRAHL